MIQECKLKWARRIRLHQQAHFSHTDAEQRPYWRGCVNIIMLVRTDSQKKKSDIELFAWIVTCHKCSNILPVTRYITPLPLQVICYCNALAVRRLVTRWSRKVMLCRGRPKYHNIFKCTTLVSTVTHEGQYKETHTHTHTLAPLYSDSGHTSMGDFSCSHLWWAAEGILPSQMTMTQIGTLPTDLQFFFFLLHGCEGCNNRGRRELCR